MSSVKVRRSRKNLLRTKNVHSYFFPAAKVRFPDSVRIGRLVYVVFQYAEDKINVTAD